VVTQGVAGAGWLGSQMRQDGRGARRAITQRGDGETASWIYRPGLKIEPMPAGWLD